MKPLTRALVAGLFILAVTLSGIGHWADVHGEVAPGCAEASAHFCPDSTPQDAGPCALCRAAAGGLESVTVAAFELTVAEETLASPAAGTAPQAILSASSAPRAPPIG